MPFTKALYCCTVTITTTAQPILALILALGGQYSNVPSSSRSYNFQADPANSNNVFLGDENLSTASQQCGENLGPGVAFLDRASVPGLAPLGLWWGKTSVGTALLNITVFGE